MLIKEQLAAIAAETQVQAYDMYVAALLPMMINRFRDQLGTCFRDDVYPIIIRDVNMVAKIMLAERSKQWTL